MSDLYDSKIVADFDRFFANGMVSFGLTYVPVTTMTYVSDAYLPVNADALMLVNGLKVSLPTLFQIKLTLVERCCFWICVCCSSLGQQFWSSQCFWDSGWYLCCYHASGVATAHLWRTPEKYHGSVEDHSVALRVHTL